MMTSGPDRVDDVLTSSQAGDEAAGRRLFQIVYDELRTIASGLLGGDRTVDTLHPTALVHEAYLRLIGHDRGDWNSRAHFLAVAAKAMRQIIVDHARRRQAAKRGGQWRRVTLTEAAEKHGRKTSSDVDLLALDEALTKLGQLNERQCRIVELRYLAGLSVEQTALVMEVSQRTVKLDWRMARAWLNRELRKGETT